MRKHPEAEGRSDELGLLEELGILRFENTTVSELLGKELHWMTAFTDSFKRRDDKDGS